MGMDQFFGIHTDIASRCGPVFVDSNPAVLLATPMLDANMSRRHDVRNTVHTQVRIGYVTKDALQESQYRFVRH